MSNWEGESRNRMSLIERTIVCTHCKYEVLKPHEKLIGKCRSCRNMKKNQPYIDCPKYKFGT